MLREIYHFRKIVLTILVHGRKIVDEVFTMRMLMQIRLPNGSYNAAVRDGSAGPKTNAILAESRPEAVYFTEMNGQRTVVMIVELAKAAMIPTLAEPWFLSFDAEVAFHPVMSEEDLQAAGFDDLARKWG